MQWISLRTVKQRKRKQETESDGKIERFGRNTVCPPGGGGGGVLPYIGYIGMCGPKGYGFSAVLVINGVSILADFGHFVHK